MSKNVCDSHANEHISNNFNSPRFMHPGESLRFPLLFPFPSADQCLFRFRDKSTSSESSNKRYVITNPPSDFNLLPSDHVSSGGGGEDPALADSKNSTLQVFVLMQFDPGMEYQPGWGDGESQLLFVNNCIKTLTLTII